MSVAVCRSSSAPFQFEFEKEVIGSMFEPITMPEMSNKGQEPPGQVEIWAMIQSQKASDPAAPPYVHPLVRRSSSLMSQQSLEMCTESLGSESGSADFSSSFSDNDVKSEPEAEVEEEKEEITVMQQEKGSRNGRKELSSVNYHCSISRRSPHRSFPPPLPSISRRDGPCIQMRPHRRDGRLVVEAVPVPSQNYLHARREHGRLLLSFIDATSHQPCNEADTITEMLQLPKDLKVEEQAAIEQESEEEEEEEDDDDGGEELEEEEEEEEEVEVVDRGTMVEVKVSTQPQQLNGAMKVHRSSLVINKFVGGTPKNQWLEELPPPPPRRLATTPTTAAAAAVAASSVSASSEEVAERMPAMDNKLLFTSKRRNREELLHNMRRCSELRRPLFYFEPYCIATSS